MTSEFALISCDPSSTRRGANRRITPSGGWRRSTSRITQSVSGREAIPPARSNALCAPSSRSRSCQVAFRPSSNMTLVKALVVVSAAASTRNRKWLTSIRNEPLSCGGRAVAAALAVLDLPWATACPTMLSCRRMRLCRARTPPKSTPLPADSTSKKRLTVHSPTDLPRSTRSCKTRTRCSQREKIETPRPGTQDRNSASTTSAMVLA